MSPRGRRWHRRWHGRGPRGDETPGDRRTPVLDRASECRCPGRRPGPGQGQAWAAPGRECPRGSSLTRGERRTAQRQNGAHVCAGRGSPAPPGGPASAGVGGGASGRGRRQRSAEPAPRAAAARGLGLLCGPGRRVHGASAAETAREPGLSSPPRGRCRSPCGFERLEQRGRSPRWRLQSPRRGRPPSRPCTGHRGPSQTSRSFVVMGCPLASGGVPAGLGGAMGPRRR